MKKIVLFLSACILCIGQAVSGNVLTVNDVNVPQGGQTTLEIGCEFDTEYTAFELQLSLPEGLSLLDDGEGYPVIEKAFDTNHVFTGNLLPSNGNYKITCRSMDNISIPTNGVLFRVIVQADVSLPLGSSLTATVTASEFTRTSDSNGESLADVAFNVNITEFRTVLDETSTATPTSATGANVRVKRTIKAGEWSTICLPFAMTAEQVTAAFGAGVKIGDFKGCDVDDETGDVKVKFDEVTAIEANHPYIIKVKTDVAEFTADGVDIAPASAEVKMDKKGRKYNSFIGNYENGTVLEDGFLFLSGNNFNFSNGKTKIKAFRGYFVFDAADVYYESRLAISFADEATGIAETVRTRSGENDILYSLGGQRVSKPAKGIYVRDGKKVIIK